MVGITPRPLDRDAIEAVVAWTGAGAILTFVGVARDTFEGRAVLGLEYEVYPELAVPEMAAIRDEIHARWPGARLAMVHRTGRVGLGEASVIIAVAAPHRDQAYQASRAAIEALKARVPIWKKELYRDGASWKANAPAAEAT